MTETFDAQFWLGLLQIIGIDLILSGDNAVVIALACRDLPAHQRRWGVMAGAGAAVALRVIFTLFIAVLLTVPYLKLVGGALLLWIGWKLLKPADDHDSVQAGSGIWNAIRIIVIADAVMSLDNVLAIAAAAKGSYLLLVLGLLISIPLVVFGAQLMLRLIERLPIIVALGAALIAYIGAEVFLADPVWSPWLETTAPWLKWAFPIAAGVGVVLVADLTAPVPFDPGKGQAVGGAATIAAWRLGFTMLGRIIATRAPWIVGALGYTAGEVSMADPTVGHWIDTIPVMETAGPVITAAIAIAVVLVVARLRGGKGARTSR